MDIFDKDWADFVDRDHLLHPTLSCEQVEFTLISMCQRAISSCIQFLYLSNEEMNQELQPSIDAMKAFNNDVVSTP